MTQDVFCDELVLRVPKGLKSPNVGRGGRWWARHRETKAWEQEIWVALAGTRSSGMFPSACARKQRSRVTVTRIVPSKRNFIKDADNLMFCTKALLDALKRLGLIYDDSMKWLEQPMPLQAVGADWATIIQIEVL